MEQQNTDKLTKVLTAFDKNRKEQHRLGIIPIDPSLYTRTERMSLAEEECDRISDRILIKYQAQQVQLKYNSSRKQYLTKDEIQNIEDFCENTPSFFQ